MDYKSLIGKKINVESKGTIINSFKIKKILPTFKVSEENGRVYKCTVDWNKKDIWTYPVINIDEKTLDELLKSKESTWRK